MIGVEVARISPTGSTVTISSRPGYGATAHLPGIDGLGFARAPAGGFTYASCQRRNDHCWSITLTNPRKKPGSRRPERWGEIGILSPLFLESNLHAGSQPIPADLSQLRYGVSVTDPCMDWETTTGLLRDVLPARR